MLFSGHCFCHELTHSLVKIIKVSKVAVASENVFLIVFLLVTSCLLITPIKCLKGHKSLGWLCCYVFTHSINRERITRSPMKLFWTAENNS